MQAANNNKKHLVLNILHKGMQSFAIALTLYMATLGVPIPWIDRAFAEEKSSEAITEHLLALEGEHAQFFVNGSDREWRVEVVDGREAITLPASRRVPKQDETAPRLEYDVFFPKAGVYFVWIRGMSNTFAQPIHFGLDGETIEDGAGIELENDGVWRWNGGRDQARAFVFAPSSVESGRAHRLQIFAPHNAEINIDRIVLSTNASYRPESSGPTGNNGKAAWRSLKPVELPTTLAVEAEHYSDSVSTSSQIPISWVNETIREAKKGELEVVSAKNGKQNSSLGEATSNVARLTYSLDLPHSGKFFLWVRGRALSESGTRSQLSHPIS